ncbi:hypothetical protein [Microvirga pudoricolor]|uniref:hypothetical protein n=1 Tax=Microvirga pudoricolor TaxID=2778729 RepID=UPI0019518C73|nr:hypothetical protein [Microvirga pudoricolor]MBM6594098.1 hypothetical protein [Microvirga pudoricolor]
MAAKEDKTQPHRHNLDDVLNERAKPNAEKPGGPEGNETLREAWDEPGGDAYAYQQAMGDTGGRGEGHDALTAAETPETTRHLNDATIKPGEADATREAIERATAVNGKE